MIANKSITSFRVGLLMSLCLVGWPQKLLAQDRFDILPDSVVALLDIGAPHELYRDVFSHPLHTRLRSLEVYQHLMRGKEMLQAKGALALFEANMGMRLEQFIAELSSGGISIAVDSESNGVVLLSHAESEATLSELRAKILDTLTALPNFENEKIKQGEYRGIEAFSIDDELRVATYQDTLIVTNKAELGKTLIDNLLDETDTPLADKASFALAHESRGTGDIWGYADIEFFRNSGAARELYSGRTENPLVEILIGGVMDNLKHTSHVSAQLNLETTALELQLATPHESDWSNGGREYFFGIDNASAPPLIECNDRIFAFSAYRGLSEMWLRSGDYLTEKAADDLAKADAQLSTFFAGKDFGEDILGAIGPGIQFLAARHQSENGAPKPAIKLPCFALQVQLEQPDKSIPEFRRVFQSFIGFLNVVGAMNGQPQFDQDVVKTERYQLISASYVPPLESEWEAAAINFNFSPTLVFADDRLILASTTSLAKQLAESHSPSPSAKLPNTHAQISAEDVKEALALNRQHLVAQNMLEKGHERSAAENEIGLLLQAIGLLEEAKLSMETTDSELRVSARVSVEE